MEVIPNAAMHVSEHYSDVTEKRVIAVGRLDYQKGFDRLIEAWQLIQHSKSLQTGTWIFSDRENGRKCFNK